MFRINRQVIIFPVLFLVLLVLPVSAQQGPRILVSPYYSLPLGESSDFFNYGIGASLEGIFPLGSSLFELYGQLDYQNTVLQSDAGNLQLVMLGGGAYFMPLRGTVFSAGLFVGGGGFMGLYEGNSPLFNPYVKGGITADFNFGSGFKLSFSPAYRTLFSSRNGQVGTLYSALDFSIKLSFEPGAMGSRTRRSKIKIMPPEFDQIFPVIYKYYDKNSFGTVTIINEESSTISDVLVEFYIPQYMDGPHVIAEIPEIKKNQEVEIPITALFKNDVLDITEKDSAQSQIVVSYTMGKNNLEKNRNESVRIYDRNSITWDDDRKAAAFVTAKDPTILKFSRNITSEVNQDVFSMINQNLTDAVALFEGLREYGIEYKIDPDSSYEILSGNEGVPDYLQFPVQTLDYKTGDCDDLAILYASMLEAVAVETAFVTVPGHIYLAFALGMDEAGASKYFSTMDQFIFTEGETWVPVEVTLLNKGFFKAWDTGAREWNEAQAMDNGELIPIRDAWSVYEPTWFGAGEENSIIERFPDTRVVTAEYENSMHQFIQVQIGPMVKKLEESLAKRPSPRLNNRLGTLYARYGMFREAEGQFLQAARANYVPALINLGNLSFVKEDYQEALTKYEQAYKKNNDSTDVLLGIARAQFELAEYDKARENYEFAEVLDPGKAERYAYITGGSSEIGRAADSSERNNVDWSDE